MTISRFKRYIFLLLVLINGEMYAQSVLKVRASVNKNSILIGEQLQLKLEAAIPETIPIRFFYIDTINHFEIRNKSKIDTVNTSEGTFLSQIYTLTSFDSGQWVIPPFLYAADRDVQTDSITVDVTFAAFDPAKDYNDVKDIIAADILIEKETKTPWWYFAAGAALLLAVILYFIFKKKKTVTGIKETIDPYTDANTELEKLLKDRPPAKEFHTRVTDIFKTYLSKKKNIGSLQSTSDELIKELKVFFGEKDLAQLKQTLLLSDFVKFAKYQSTEDENKQVFTTIKESISIINKTD